MTITGIVKRIIFRKEDFFIFELKDGTKAKGNGPIKVGNKYQMEGEFKPTSHGRTFFMTDVTELEQTDEKTIEKLQLLIRGIGQKSAEKIVEEMGEDCLSTLQKEPHQIYHFFSNARADSIFEQMKAIDIDTLGKDLVKELAKSLKGVGKVTIQRWVDSLEEDPRERLKDPYAVFDYFGSDKAKQIYEDTAEIPKGMEIIQEIQEKGLSERVSWSLFNQYRLNVWNALAENPYRLVSEGVPFHLADDLALNEWDMEPYSVHRLVFAAEYLLRKHEEEGSSFMFLSEVIENIQDLLNVEDGEFVEEIIAQASEWEEPPFILKEDDRLYRRVMFFTERKIALKINQLAQKKRSVPSQVKDKLNQSGLSDIQKEAVKTALQSGISIITGGPGTGKTTSLKELCQMLENMKASFLLAAPTGRAAKRLSEATGHQASTLHRALQYQQRGIFGTFLINDKFPFKERYIIVDESSMLDMYLTNSLLKAIDPQKTSLVLVGDVNQLPSISSGNILSDICQSNMVPTVTLQTIFRQQEKSDIVINANRILEEKGLELSGKDMNFVPINGAGDVLPVLKKHIKDPSVQVLTPMRVGPTGSVRLNEALQEWMNPNGEEIYWHGKIFRVGDRVIQQSNNYDKEVFNGEMGTIEAIENHVLTVYFPNNPVEKIKYNHYDAYELDHAFAITTHKSQGSEFDHLVFVVEGMDEMLYRELIYTGITRAKKQLTIISSMTKEAFGELPKANQRYTGLDRLIEQPNG